MAGKSSEREITSVAQANTLQGGPSEVELPTHEEYQEIVASEKLDVICRDPETGPFAVAFIRRARRRIIINEQSPQTPETD